MTNADKLRSMTDEELANIVKFWLECDDCPLQNDRGCNGNCELGALKWLKQAVEKDEIP